MAKTHPYQHAGRGSVPPMNSLLAAAFKEAVQRLHSSLIPTETMGHQLDFTTDGLSAASVLEFFDEQLKIKAEPIVETGNKYGVSTEFHQLNAGLILEQVQCDHRFEALCESNRQRVLEILRFMIGNEHLRNRNPLHCQLLDSCVIGNLLNFPKHILGFTFGCYATDGNEALSLLLYSYRQQCNAASTFVLYVSDDVDTNERHENIKLCAARLRMGLSIVKISDLVTWQQKTSEPSCAVVMTSFENSCLATLADFAGKHRLPLHIHIWDEEWRNVFKSNEEPVHFELPGAVTSVSIEEGLLFSAYTLYRDVSVRDLHFDVSQDWDTAYMSPNEGGSGASLPLFLDFVFILCGWSVLREISLNISPSNAIRRLQPSWIRSDSPRIVKPAIEDLREWAKQATSSRALTRQELECSLVSFELEFLGGKNLNLEAMSTGGGTRSINLAFESIALRAETESHQKFKVVIGNPHLAVERAARRFGFDLVRIAVDGVICVDRLKEAVKDPLVHAVYTQTLSYTDGVSDPLAEILNLVEAENKTRTGSPITLVNDSCLAFSVLVHNNGQEGQRSMRILDLVANSITPTIVTLDAHKHLGTDKGVSSVIGTQGTLSCLQGHVKVGAQPSKEELVRALANLWLLGHDEYNNLYHTLTRHVEKAVASLESAGITIVHAKSRVKGSTVFGVEDPSGLISKKLRKLGYAFAPLFGMYPNDPSRCQTGFSFSMTLYALREYRNGKSALDVFVSDITNLAKEAQVKSKRNLFKEDSLAGNLWVGGFIDMWAFSLLRNPGIGRRIVELIVRRYPSCMLDYGMVCSQKLQDPIAMLAKRVLSFGVCFLLLLLSLRRKKMQGKHRLRSAM